MGTLLAALKGARKIAQRTYPEGIVEHWLLPTGDVLEVVYS